MGSEPKINLGETFQAVIPDMLVNQEPNPDRITEQLMWKLSKYQRDSEKQWKRIEQYMELSCSAAVPYGGCNKEFALHCFMEAKGDILEATAKLLTPAGQQTTTGSATTRQRNTEAEYRYTGSGLPWENGEKETFDDL